MSIPFLLLLTRQAKGPSTLVTFVLSVSLAPSCTLPGLCTAVCNLSGSFHCIPASAPIFPYGPVSRPSRRLGVSFPCSNHRRCAKSQAQSLLDAGTDSLGLLLCPQNVCIIPFTLLEPSRQKTASSVPSTPFQSVGPFDALSHHLSPSPFLQPPVFNNPLLYLMSRASSLSHFLLSVDLDTLFAEALGAFLSCGFALFFPFPCSALLDLPLSFAIWMLRSILSLEQKSKQQVRIHLMPHCSFRSVELV